MLKKVETTLNLPVNVIGALCYVPWVGWVVGIVVILLEKNAGLRWHAVQGMMIAGIFLLLAMVLFPLAGILWITGLVIKIYAAVKVYGGKLPRLYKISEWTDKIVKRLNI